MSSSDWTELSNGLGQGTVDRGATSGGPKPSSTGPSNDFVFGFNALVATEGAVGFHTNQTDFSPLKDDAGPADTGGSVRAAIQRGLSAAAIDFSVLLFIGLEGTSVNDYGYMLGLSDADPAHIVLRKGQLVGGVPDHTAGTFGNLRRSIKTVSLVEYVHLRLDMVHNNNGDVILKVFENILSTHPIGGAPSWVAVDGMADFVDDALGVNSQEAGVDAAKIQPFIGGYVGFGFQSANINRRAWFDQIEIARQL